MQALLLRVLRLAFLLYYVISITFRLAFIPHFDIFRGFLTALFFDYLADLFFTVDYLTELIGHNEVTPASDSFFYGSRSTKRVMNRLFKKSSPASINTPQDAARRAGQWIEPMYQFIAVFPFEAFAYLSGYENYYALRALRLFRCLYFNLYWREVAEMLEKYRIATTAGTQRITLLALMMALVGHVFACLYYAMGLASIQEGNLNNWVTNDNLAILNTTTGAITFEHPLSYRYLRAIYWSIQTVTSITFGDIVAHSQAETWFCIFYFLVTAAIVYLSIANLTMVITNLDSARTENLMKIIKFEKYAAYRQLPPALTNRVVSYYQHQWERLRGVDEQQILSELPSNLVEQVLHQVVRDRLVHVGTLHNLNMGCLNALAERVESFVYSPTDAIMEVDSQVSGVYIIAEGIVKCSMLHTKQGIELAEGQVFGEKALRSNYTSVYNFTAKTFCEVLLLRGPAFRHICQMYLTAAEIDLLIVKIDHLDLDQAITDGWSALNKRSSQLGSSRATVMHVAPKGSKQAGAGQSSSVLQRSAAFMKPRTDKHATPPMSVMSLFRYDSSRLSVAVVVESQMYPGSHFRRAWDVLIFAGLGFYSISCGFLIQACLHQNFIRDFTPLLIAGYVVDGMYLVDLFLAATMFNYVDKGVVVTERSRIFEKFRHEHGMVTVLSHFPFDLVFGLTIDYRVIPVLRMLKMFHSWRFNAGVANLEDALLRYFNIAASFELRRFSTLYMFLFQLCHWAACAWTLMADVSTKVFHYENNWRETDMNSTYYSVNYAALSHTGGYWRSLYWAVNVMASIGMSDILAINAVEMITVVIIMFFGYLLFNTLSGAIASLMESFNRDKREFNAKVDKIRELVRYKSVSKHTENKIVRYYEYIWARYGGVDEAEVLGNLPKSLRAAVTDFVLGPLLQKIPFFDNVSEPMEQMLVLLFQTRIFLEDDALMYADEMGKEMFIIERGEVQVCSPDRATTYVTLKVGDYIGESCFLEPTKRTASAYALGYVDTYFLTRDNFLKAAEKFPSEYSEILDAIEETLQAKTEANEIIQANNTPERVKSRKSLMAKTAAPSMRIRRIMRVTSTKEEDKTAEEGRAVASVGNIHPDSAFKLYWDVMICTTLLYYTFIIPLRIALSIDPYWFILDYFFDVLNLVDNYLYIAVFAIYAGGKLLVYDEYIRAHYIKHRLVIDLTASIPYDLIALAFLDYSDEKILLIRAVLRVPKLVRLGLWSHYYGQVRHLLHLINLNSLIVRICELVASILMMSHWIGCGFYLFSIYGRRLGPCSPALLAEYGAGCEWRGTWVFQQIDTLKLPKSGGNQWSRYITAINWAITTSVGVSVGDVLVMNINETLYAFFVMFTALAINGMIIGSVMSIVNDASEESTRIYRNMEVLQTYLISNNVPLDLVHRSATHLRHLATTEGSLTACQDELFAELPHSIKLSIDSQVKTGPFLRRCPIFDFCSDEILRGISAKLQIQFNVKGDNIITGGELGYEMFFVESGSVNVVSPDGSVLYSTLEEGAFFGETAFFFRSVRSASVVVASPFCVCLRLSKADLEYELRSADFDPMDVIRAFGALQDSNERRNKAVTSNLALAKDPKSKLSKLVGLAADSHSVSWIFRMRQELSPDCWTRVVWDIMGFVFLCYYAFTIPFYVGFLGVTMDAYYRYCVVDFLIDFYWFVDILLKAYVFSYRPDLVHDTVITDGAAIWENYRDGGYIYFDVLASIPLEFFALVPGTPSVFFFTMRLNHLLRLPQINKYTNLLEHHIQEKAHVVFGRATAFLVRVSGVYLALNHWFTCLYFMIFRYAETNFSQTYLTPNNVLTDDTVDRSDVFDNIVFYYARTLYYILGTMTGAGYGDIAPYTDLEYIAQMVIAIVGAFLAATFLGFCENFLADRDAKGDNAFKTKIQQLEVYIKNKKLNPQTRVAILAHYTHLWRKVKSTRGEKNEILSSLSQSSAMELSLHLQASIIATVPLIKALPYHTQRRIALALQPQVAATDSYLYKAGDVGQCVYFISHGSVSIELESDRSMLDSRGVTSVQILLNKQEAHGPIHVAGDHFGEFCVVSASGLRADSAKVLSGTEVYSLSKTDIWEIFQYLTFEDRRAFIHELMTRVGERHHITHKLSEMLENAKSDDGRIKNLYRMAFEVMTEIVDALNEGDRAVGALDERDKNFAVKKMIRDSSNYGAFTQRDLIDLFVGEASEEVFHLSFSASSMQARLEKAKNAKSQFRSLAKKSGGGSPRISGMASLVNQLIKKDIKSPHQSPRVERSSPDQEGRRQVHLHKSNFLAGAVNRSPHRVQFDETGEEIPGAPPIPAGGFADSDMQDAESVDSSGSESPVRKQPLKKAVQAYLRNRPGAMAAAAAAAVGPPSPVTLQTIREGSGKELGASSSDDIFTPIKSEIRPASPVVGSFSHSPSLSPSPSPSPSPSGRRGSTGYAAAVGSGKVAEVPQPLRRHTSYDSAFRNVNKVAPEAPHEPELVLTVPTIDEHVDHDMNEAEQRRHRKALEVRLESRNPEFDAQVIANAMTIARTREGTGKRGGRRSSLF